MDKRFDQIKANFDYKYQDYDVLIPKLVPGYFDLKDSVLEIAKDLGISNGNVLDLGCGTAKIGEELLDQNVNLRYYGLDLSEKMVLNAKERLAKFGNRTEVFLRDMSKAEELSLPKIDAIISVLAIHHFKDKLPIYKMVYYLAVQNKCPFVLADLVVDPRRNKAVFEFRKKHMRDCGMPEESINDWFSNWDVEDKPSTIDENIQLLRLAGFKNVGLKWKNESYATFLAKE